MVRGDCVKDLRQCLGKKAIIPVVRKQEDLPAALETKASCLFLVAGDITTIKRDVRLIRERGKACFLYIDFIDGHGSDRATVRYIAREVKPTGLVTIKNHLLKYAKREGLLAIQNLFLLDSQAIRPVFILPGSTPRRPGNLAGDYAQGDKGNCGGGIYSCHCRWAVGKA